MFDITFEISIVFLNDLLRQKFVPFFEHLLIQLKQDTSKYEIKLTLIERFMPVMTST